jgi:hypothetical protein
MKHSRIKALWEQLKEDNPCWTRKRLVTELLELTEEDKNLKSELIGVIAESYLEDWKKLN